MAVIKFDVSGSDPKAAFAGGGKQPTPGVYTVKLKDCKPGFRKGDNGQPDKTAPRLEITAEIQDKKFKGSLLYDYISFSEASQWKMDQFLQVLGLASTSKRKGSFDTAKVVGKKVKVRVTGDTYNGEYRGKLNAYLPDDEADGVEDDAEDEETEEEEESEESEDSEEEEEDGPDYDALGEAADEDDETAIDTLTGLAEEAGLDPEDYETWAELATALSEAEPEEEEAEEESEEEESEDDDDEVPPYSEWSLADLKAEIENRGLEATGKKSALVAALEADDEEDPF